MKPIKLYWCDRLAGGRKNFGDWLSPELCRLLSGREIEYAEAHQADMVAIGSVLQRMRTRFWNRRVHVWGTGFMEPRPGIKVFHHYHAVRGKLTAALLPGTDISVFGDPGLLVDRLLPGHAEIPKRCAIGLVAHHVDQSHPVVTTFLDRHPEARLVDILSDTPDFLRTLAACRFVLSSSLHGLVAADAFGIPNLWVRISDQVRGGGFKFQDYYSGFGLGPMTPLTLDAVNDSVVQAAVAGYQRNGLERMKSMLLESFPFPRSDGLR
jgi:pyruvyltransferase